MSKFRWFGLLLLFSLCSVKAQGAESDPVITLERTACFGTCPVYRVSILEDGTVLYDGDRFVTMTGEQTGEITPETVELMVEAFEKAGYFDWNESYNENSFGDLPTVITSVTRGGLTHRIERYSGDYTAPFALSFLEFWIDQMTNTALWTGAQPNISIISNGTTTPLITLQHGPNRSYGPVYSIAAYEDGVVIYTGVAM